MAFLSGVFQRGFLQKLTRRMHLSKLRTSKFSESAQLLCFYLVAMVWAVDIAIWVTFCGEFCSECFKCIFFAARIFYQPESHLGKLPTQPHVVSFIVLHFLSGFDYFYVCTSFPEKFFMILQVRRII